MGLQAPVLSVLSGGGVGWGKDTSVLWSHGDSQRCRSGKYWYVGTFCGAHCPGKRQSSGSGSQYGGSWTRLWGWLALQGVEGVGEAPQHTTRHGVGGWGPRGAGAPVLEVEEISGAPKVSVPGWHKVATCHQGVGPWHLLAWLPLLCLIPHLAWGHGVISCSSLLSPLIDLTPSGGPGTWRIKTGCVALSWLWVSDDWIVHWH